MTATAETLERVAAIVADWRDGRWPAGQALIAIETMLREAGAARQAETRAYADPAEIYSKPLG